MIQTHNWPIMNHSKLFGSYLASIGQKDLTALLENVVEKLVEDLFLAYDKAIQAAVFWTSNAIYGNQMMFLSWNLK